MKDKVTAYFAGWHPIQHLQYFCHSVLHHFYKEESAKIH